MKNLKKMLAVVTAIAAMFASVSAFAQKDLTECDTGISGSCTGEDGANPVVTATVSSSIVDGGEMTFLVLNKDVNPLTTDVAAADILYIDQHSSTEGTSFTGAINLDRVDDDLTALPEGTYFVRVGYNSKTTGKFAIANAKLVIESAGPEETTITIKWGDIDGNGNVGGLDMSATLSAMVGTYNNYTLTQGGNSLDVRVGNNVTITDGVNKATVKWGDIDGNGNVGGLDMSATLSAMVGTYNNYTIGDIDVTVGSNCEVIVPKE